jgi:hypothetical protein
MAGSARFEWIAEPFTTFPDRKVGGTDSRTLEFYKDIILTDLGYGGIHNPDVTGRLDN